MSVLKTGFTDLKTAADIYCLMFQLEEQTRFLKKHVCHAGVGTPNRVQALLKAGKFLNMATFISSGVQR